MDPNKTLQDMRDLAEELLFGGPSGHKLEDLADLLAEATINLDEWLSKGGFLPDDWEEE
jgi:hypothetical protein